jgi:hypothetical protein
VKPITIGKRTLRILFSYPDKNKAPHQSLVTCKVTEKILGPAGETVSRLVGQGTAKCCEGDTFDKELGRRLSLTRAVKELPREVRAALWIAYWGRAGEAMEETLLWTKEN